MTGMPAPIATGRRSHRSVGRKGAKRLAARAGGAPQIAASIAEFGFVNPLLVDRDGTVIAGHGRLLAARQLGLTEVPVIELAHLTPLQRRAYCLADNRLAELAGWDEEMLRIELAELQDADFDLNLIGFDEDTLAELLAEDEPEGGGLTDDDAVPEAGETTVTRPGDLWSLGDHRVLCGDATVAADYRHLLGDELADLVFTDPPYNVAYAKDTRPIKNDALGDGFGPFLEAACRNLLAVTKGAVYLCMSSSELDTLQAAFRAAGGKWSTFITWAKNTFTLGRSDYQRQCAARSVGGKRAQRDAASEGTAEPGMNPNRRHGVNRVRAHPIRMASGHRAFLVWGERPGGRVVRQQTYKKRSASHHEAGGTGGAGSQEQQQDPRHRARSLRRIRHHPHRQREDRASGATDGVGSEVRGRDHSPLAGLHREEGQPRRGRCGLR
jgi:hypothetical protein